MSSKVFKDLLPLGNSKQTNMKFFTPRTLLSALLMVSALFFVSCGDDDDKVNCDEAYDDIEDAFEDYYDAVFEGDCDDLDDLYDVAVAAIKKGKDCEDVKEELEDAGYDSVSEYLDDFEEEHEDNVDNCEEPV